MSSLKAVRCSRAPIGIARSVSWPLKTDKYLKMKWKKNINKAIPIQDSRTERLSKSLCTLCFPWRCHKRGKLLRPFHFACKVWQSSFLIGSSPSGEAALHFDAIWRAEAIWRVCLRRDSISIPRFSYQSIGAVCLPSLLAMFSNIYKGTGWRRRSFD